MIIESSVYDSHHFMREVNLGQNKWSWLIGWLISIRWFPIRTQILILCSQTEFLKYSICAHICVCKHARITHLWTHQWTHTIVNIWTIIYRGFWSTILAHLKTEITWLHNFCQKKKGILNSAYRSLCTACIVPLSSGVYRIVRCW